MNNIIIKNTKKTLQEVKKINKPIYFINYFDEQRFGKEKKNHILGKHLVKKEFKEFCDELKLEVIKNMNFRVYMFIRRLRSFASQYGSIIALFASILMISWYMLLLTGGNPLAIVGPILFFIILISYFFLKKKKEEKI